MVRLCWLHADDRVDGDAAIVAAHDCCCCWMLFIAAHKARVVDAAQLPFCVRKFKHWTLRHSTWFIVIIACLFSKRAVRLEWSTVFVFVCVVPVVRCTNVSTLWTMNAEHRAIPAINESRRLFRFNRFGIESIQIGICHVYKMGAGESLRMQRLFSNNNDVLIRIEIRDRGDTHTKEFVISLFWISSFPWRKLNFVSALIAKFNYSAFVKFIVALVGKIRDKVFQCANGWKYVVFTNWGRKLHDACENIAFLNEFYRCAVGTANDANDGRQLNAWL